MNRLRKYLCLFAVCLTVISSAQEQYGRVGSNYSPTTSLWFNPALVSDSRVFVDVHFTGTDAFFHNNYVYLPGGSLTRKTLQAGTVEPQFNTRRNRINAYADSKVNGPAFTFPIRKVVMGLTSRMRTMASIRGVDAELVKMAVDGLQHPDMFDRTFVLERIRVNALSTIDIGAVASGILKQSGRDLHSGGVHLRRVFPLAGASLLLHDARFALVDSTDFMLENLQGEFGVSDVEALSNNLGLRFVGGGWGIDLGWSWKRAYRAPGDYRPHNPSDNCAWCDYQWKLSVAVLDLGWVSFDPPYYVGEVSSTDESSWEDYDSWNPESTDEVEATFEDVFGVTERGDRKYRMMLPTAASVQYDRHFYKGFYVSANAVLGVPWMRTKGIQRPSSMAVVPRWETKRLEVAMPVSMAAMQRPTWGLMLRLNSIVIGSDNLWPLLFRGDLYGSDVYVHIKYSLFRNPQCRSVKNRVSRARHPRSGRKGHVACPDW